ncbi:MAG TPA: homoserine kinase [Syntrophomonadaceae bacterium]|nr:homoserine kinase [Syntrophomonadaceae bacterium]
MDMVKVRVPATTANLGPGYDTLGMAVSMFLEVEFELSSKHSTVNAEGLDCEQLSSAVEDHLIIQAAEFVFKKAGQPRPPLHLFIKNGIPVAKGLGSSAAAIAAGMFGANVLLGTPFTRQQLINWAVQREGHADNVVPAFVGGLTVNLLNGDKVFYEKLSVPPELQLILLVPDFTLATQKSRSVLPAEIPLEQAVASMQRSCLLVAGLAKGRVEHLRWAMDDRLIQPLRKQFVPGFDQVLAAARKAGAIGVVMSGAGPSIVAFSQDKVDDIGVAMLEAFEHAGNKGKIFYPAPCSIGAQIIN